MIRTLALFVCLYFSICTFAQMNEPFGLSFLRVIDNDNVSFSKLKLKLGLPISFSNPNHKLINSFTYENIAIDYNRDYQVDINEINQFHSISYGFGYIKLLKKNWTLITISSAIINSNLVKGITNDDLFYSVMFGFEKKYGSTDKPAKLFFGLLYNQAIGINLPIPAIQYENRFHPQFSYVIGVPFSQFAYFPNDKMSFSIRANLDGFTGNIQNNLVMNNGNTADKAVSNIIAIGLTVDYGITNFISAYGTLGFTPLNNAQLLNDDFKEVLDFENDASPYFNVGLRLNFQKN